MSDLCLRPYRSGDGPAINRGFNRIFGTRRSLEEWEWKFPPSERESSILVAVEDGRILAHFAAVPVRLRLPGRTLGAGQVVDVYSNRRPGLFLRVVERFYQELCGPDKLELIYGFPGSRHFRLGVMKLGYSQPLPVPFWARRMEDQPAGRDGLGRLLAGVRVREGPDPAATERLWQRSRHRLAVAAVRDRRWVRRRFTGRPQVAYVHLTAWEGGEPRAQAILRRPASPPTTGSPEGPDAGARALRWAELLWDGGSSRALVALDREVARRARGAGALESHLWLGGDREAAEILVRRGWRRRTEPQDLHLGAVSFVEGVDALEVCRRLYVTMGDADLV